METENYLTEPTLEEYGLDAHSYTDHKNQKDGLEKLKPSFEFSWWIIWQVIIGALIIGVIFQSQVVGYLTFAAGIIYLFIERYREKGRQKIRLEIDNKIELIKNKVYPFEEASQKFYESYLKQFFQNNLYKKRSGNEKFEQSLAEFSSMLNEAEEIDKRLIFTHIYTWKYRDYIEKRQENHEFRKISQSQEKKYFSSFNEISTSFIREEKEKTEVIQKPKSVSPQVKYRVARKIDNWEEINKKRKETGDKGESIVFALEQEYFQSIDRKDLADRICRVSLEDDCSGYDILSFFDDGKEKYIEVKSTTASIESQFNISKNELDFLKENSVSAFIYRVSLATEPPEIEVRSSPEVLESEIIPVSYIVKIK